jgi:glycosyltransferase involved in cell wall biosynthesis
MPREGAKSAKEDAKKRVASDSEISLTNLPHVIVDARFTDHRRGGDRCRLELAKGLIRRGGCRYTLLVYRGGADVLRSMDRSVRTVVAPHPPGRHPHADVFEHVTLPRICRRLKADLYHGTFQVMPWRRAAPVTVVTIHDLALFSFPQAYGRKFGPYMRTLLRRAIRKSDHLVTVSDATRAEVERRFPKSAGKITTIHNGVGTEFSPDGSPGSSAADTEVRRRLGLPAEYVLFVGNLERKKNLPRLIRAFLSLRAAGAISESLVVAGSRPDKLPADESAELFGGPSTQDWTARAAGLGVHFTGYVSDDDLPAVYRGARAVAYPSLYEGFGMPVLEGMAAGVPVLTSDVSSLPEVAGGAARLVSPTDVGSIAAGLRDVLQDQTWRRTAIAAGLRRARELSWDRHVERVERLYLSLAGTRRQND